MAQGKTRQESRLQELILKAKELNIQVRAEKLLREAGYRARSGSCRLNGQDIILLDRTAPIGDQIEFLAAELAEALHASKIIYLTPAPGLEIDGEIWREISVDALRKSGAAKAEQLFFRIQRQRSTGPVEFDERAAALVKGRARDAQTSAATLLRAMFASPPPDVASAISPGRPLRVGRGWSPAPSNPAPRPPVRPSALRRAAGRVRPCPPARGRRPPGARRPGRRR